jgi:Spy/CpxP family protein refolding chaperone
MNGLSRWKVVLLVLATFVVGAVTGAFFVMGSAKDEMRRTSDPRRWFSNTPDRWRSEMKLTPDQEQKIRPILQQIDDELANLRAMDLRETEGILARGEDRINAIVTPEQRERLRQTFERRRQRVRDWLGVNDQEKPLD